MSVLVDRVISGRTTLQKAIAISANHVDASKLRNLLIDVLLRAIRDDNLLLFYEVEDEIAKLDNVDRFGILISDAEEILKTNTDDAATWFRGLVKGLLVEYTPRELTSEVRGLAIQELVLVLRSLNN